MAAAGNPLAYEDSTGLESKYRENFNTFAAPLFWAPPGQDARFELGRSVGLGTAATAQVVTAAVAGFGAAATLGGGPTAVGAPALAAEAAQQLSMAGVNVVAAVAAWQNAAQMAAKRPDSAGSEEPMKVGRKEWKKTEPGDKSIAFGCEEVAADIQKAIGGELETVTGPGNFLGRVKNSAGEFVNPSAGELGWRSHKLVLKDGKVYDMLTGPNGMEAAAYKSLGCRSLLSIMQPSWVSPHRVELVRVLVAA